MIGGNMEFRLDNLEVERSNKSVYSEDGKTIKLFAENYPSSRVLNEAINLAKVAEVQIFKYQS